MFFNAQFSMVDLILMDLFLYLQMFNILSAFLISSDIKKLIIYVIQLNVVCSGKLLVIRLYYPLNAGL